LSVNVSDALSKLRVSEKPSQSEKSAGGLTKGGDSEGGDSEGGDSEGGDSEGGDSEGGDSKGGDSEGGDSVEASLSIIISFILKIRLYLPSTS
jgi:hypothetical protein